jgi:hypothetical protein
MSTNCSKSGQMAKNRNWPRFLGWDTQASFKFFTLKMKKWWKHSKFFTYVFSEKGVKNNGRFSWICSLKNWKCSTSGKQSSRHTRSWNVTIRMLQRSMCLTLPNRTEMSLVSFARLRSKYVSTQFIEVELILSSGALFCEAERIIPLTPEEGGVEDGPATNSGHDNPVVFDLCHASPRLHAAWGKLSICCKLCVRLTLNLVCRRFRSQDCTREERPCEERKTPFSTALREWVGSGKNLLSGFSG